MGLSCFGLKRMLIAHYFQIYFPPFYCSANWLHPCEKETRQTAYWPREMPRKIVCFFFLPELLLETKNVLDKLTSKLYHICGLEIMLLRNFIYINLWLVNYQGPREKQIQSHSEGLLSQPRLQRNPKDLDSG